MLYGCSLISVMLMKVVVKIMQLNISSETINEAFASSNYAKNLCCMEGILLYYVHSISPLES